MLGVILPHQVELARLGSNAAHHNVLERSKAYHNGQKSVTHFFVYPAFTQDFNAPLPQYSPF